MADFSQRPPLQPPPATKMLPCKPIVLFNCSVKVFLILKEELRFCSVFVLGIFTELNVGDLLKHR